jgi:hypothetical protein
MCFIYVIRLQVEAPMEKEHHNRGKKESHIDLHNILQKRQGKEIVIEIDQKNEDTGSA